MGSLSKDQRQQLNAYSVYTSEPSTVLFRLDQLQDDAFLPDFMNIMHTLSGVTSKTIAISYFTRRYGMFIAMQFYMLSTYDEIWDSAVSAIHFGAREEFGKAALCTFVNENDWRVVNDDEREVVIEHILLTQCHEIIQQLRKITSVSPLMLWENIFGYMLWHFHTLLSNPGTEDPARIDLDILEDDKVWANFASHSNFAKYTGCQHPSKLINMPVRKTCCFSKDIPGWMQCGFCPLK
ncbi:Fe-S oxidoreductase [Viridibacillus sp. YIM B01967]|uniref:Fe-S oxidoreductase n=1 Tax=Viridibacillus soli TaxID=2798301 RepID=A0ABS1H949_9BACL|nr:Fe-S oxidoreductase [Viridibacillus soli]MBK3495543.1 Fe-S oxidoreductase [Viridibacillus soli]